MRGYFIFVRYIIITICGNVQVIKSNTYKWHIQSGRLTCSVCICVRSQTAWKRRDEENKKKHSYQNWSEEKPLEWMNDDVGAANKNNLFCLCPTNKLFVFLVDVRSARVGLSQQKHIFYKSILWQHWLVGAQCRQCKSFRRNGMNLLKITNNIKTTSTTAKHNFTTN